MGRKCCLKVALYTSSNTEAGTCSEHHFSTSGWGGLTFDINNLRVIVSFLPEGFFFMNSILSFISVNHFKSTFKITMLGPSINNTVPTLYQSTNSISLTLTECGRIWQNPAMPNQRAWLVRGSDPRSLQLKQNLRLLLEFPLVSPLIFFLTENQMCKGSDYTKFTGRLPWRSSLLKV